MEALRWRASGGRTRVEDQLLRSTESVTVNTQYTISRHVLYTSWSRFRCFVIKYIPYTSLQQIFPSLTAVASPQLRFVNLFLTDMLRHQLLNNNNNNNNNNKVYNGYLVVDRDSINCVMCVRRVVHWVGVAMTSLARSDVDGSKLLDRN